ncbi:unnamed protein product [Polarella glacialis]|uniref:Uncharacterized protein n=1 Tax=Polarella glacialis TaxID=89957 RepID=A0A813I2I4_POLGL|nr:unnamed protein product [Polarella glacialis]
MQNEIKHLLAQTGQQTTTPTTATPIKSNSNNNNNDDSRFNSKIVAFAKFGLENNSGITRTLGATKNRIYRAANDIMPRQLTGKKKRFTIQIKDRTRRRQACHVKRMSRNWINSRKSNNSQNQTNKQLLIQGRGQPDSAVCLAKSRNKK